MSKLDQFESVFRAASKAVYRHATPKVARVLLVTDFDAPTAEQFSYQNRQFLSVLESVIFGANLGGNLTPIGSASTLVAVTIAHKHNLSLSFARFVRLALPYAVVQLLLAVVYVLLFVG